MNTRTLPAYEKREAQNQPRTIAPASRFVPRSVPVQDPHERCKSVQARLIRDKVDLQQQIRRLWISIIVIGSVSALLLLGQHFLRG